MLTFEEKPMSRRRSGAGQEQAGPPSNSTHDTADPSDLNVQKLPPWITAEEVERRFRALERLGIGRDGRPLKPGLTAPVSIDVPRKSIDVPRKSMAGTAVNTPRPRRKPIARSA
jgi:hypothetical protein